MKKIYIFITVLILAFGSRSTATMLANYPLVSDGNDSTGNNSAMTITNAPFQNGSVYCNGIYFQQPNGCEVMSPVINNFDFNSFSVCFDFNPEVTMDQPVITCGIGWRWIGLKLNSNGTVSLLVNNDSLTSSTVTYTNNQWHNCRLTYDGTTAKLFVDEQLAVSLAIALITNPGDTEIGISNHATSKAFKGWIRHLKIYNSTSAGINLSSAKKVTIGIDAMNFLSISGVQPNTTVTIYGLNGNTLLYRNSNENPIDLNFLPQGIFLARIQDENDIIIRKFLKK